MAMERRNRREQGGTYQGLDASQWVGRRAESPKLTLSHVEHTPGRPSNRCRNDATPEMLLLPSVPWGNAQAAGSGSATTGTRYRSTLPRTR